MRSCPCSNDATFLCFLKTEATDSLKIKKKLDFRDSYNDSLQSTWMRLEKYVYDTYMHANIVQNTYLRVENLLNRVLCDLHQHAADRQEN